VFKIRHSSASDDSEEEWIDDEPPQSRCAGIKMKKHASVSPRKMVCLVLLCIHSGTYEITNSRCCIQSKKRLSEARKKRVIESDEDDISPADHIAAASIEHTAVSEKSKPVRSGGDSLGRRRSTRAASQVVLARNRVFCCLKT